MFDKYFGFLRSHDEISIVSSILEHSKIDEEELLVLSRMVSIIIQSDEGDLQDMHDQICNINSDNTKTFESVSDHIIQSNFDFQKQYDLLRVQQRIDVVSSLIIGTSKRIIIFNNINGVMPKELHSSLKKLMDLVLQSHYTLVSAIEKYKESRKDVIQLIHQAEEEENMVDNTRSECLEVIYKLANEGNIKLGDFHALEGIIEYLEDISDSIKSSVTSLDWLLLN